MKALIIFLFLFPCAAFAQQATTTAPADSTAQPRKWNIQPVAIYLSRKQAGYMARRAKELRGIDIRKKRM